MLFYTFVLLDEESSDVWSSKNELILLKIENNILSIFIL